MKIRPLTLIVSMLFVSQQTVAEELKGYEPPPMFGSSSPQQNPDELIEEPEKIFPKLTKPIIKPRIKPKKNFAKKQTMVTTQGIVKGPKVMPAVKKQNVESEVTFEPDAKASSSLQERIKKKITIEKVSTKKIVKPKKKKLLAKSTKKKDWFINFLENQTDITQTHKDILLQEILPQLDMDTQARLFIEASASSSDAVKLNANRRTALSRAINIRSYLLEQKIAPDRIDVRAMGNENSTSQSNQARIKLIN